MADANAALPGGNRGIMLRIWIKLCDVVIGGSVPYGDGIRIDVICFEYPRNLNRIACFCE